VNQSEIRRRRPHSGDLSPPRTYAPTATIKPAAKTTPRAITRFVLHTFPPTENTKPGRNSPTGRCAGTGGGTAGRYLKRSRSGGAGGSRAISRLTFRHSPLQWKSVSPGVVSDPGDFPNHRWISPLLPGSLNQPFTILLALLFVLPAIFIPRISERFFRRAESIFSALRHTNC